MKNWLTLSQEVKEALDTGKPVVALESTIITHGMPYPENINTALSVERIIRNQGAVPATIAIMHGEIRVGLTEEELNELAGAKEVEKVSRRDLPVVLANRAYGSTTVAATMICAEMAGIDVFVTGGIGGVHRMGETSMDISADLEELALTNVAVVCAGAKSILDIRLTMEYLETKGVPVLGYQTSRFPAFYYQDSGFDVSATVSTPEEAAKILKQKKEMGLSGGTVIGNPVPTDAALDKSWVEERITEALAEAEKDGIKGKDTTPYLLDKLKDVSEGRTLTANIALVEHNARNGAKIAAALSAIS
ncbi:pseudouridine-5'-phosphate glycosidase [Alkalicoccus luteus]|uniref:Pseudouridine-5'-phosphate glycosidase n=1 Tax=Alkalicoccus luteus TaxID=1237094 RepID=A0A969PVX8_9BACI|nr:pseudouridine-5'-phosphate glycosidase [Alkalicoccus luteus]NJP36632.1 pseudouridine-5'-phosphate glycosidase [Alkalicoccus luteus]